MKTNYAIKLIADMRMYTAYTGTSYKAAMNAVEVLRATLIFARATAGIYVSYNQGGYSPLWLVEDGSARAENRLMKGKVIDA